MFKAKTVALVALLALFSIGCGGSGPAVKKGDKLVVAEELARERVEVEYEGGETDGFNREIPAGTVLQVVITPSLGTSIVEVVPVEFSGKSNPEEVLELFVPDRFRNKEGFRTYSIALKNEYIGSKVKKAE